MGTSLFPRELMDKERGILTESHNKVDSLGHWEQRLEERAQKVRPNDQRNLSFPIQSDPGVPFKKEDNNAHDSIMQFVIGDSAAIKRQGPSGMNGGEKSESEKNFFISQASSDSEEDY